MTSFWVAITCYIVQADAENVDNYLYMYSMIIFYIAAIGSKNIADNAARSHDYDLREHVHSENGLISFRRGPICR